MKQIEKIENYFFNTLIINYICQLGMGHIFEDG
jgi:hypothetical protein